MQSAPLVSVVICAYNAGTYLKASVDSARNQSYANLEILLVDDGSTDGSVNHLHLEDDNRIRVIRQENAGKPAAMNRALDELNGEFYAIHDADDLSHPDRVARQVSLMVEQPELAAVYCGHELVLDDRHFAPRFRAKDAPRCRADIEAFRMPAHDPTGMYRVAMVQGMRYDESLRIGEGYDYMLRVGESFPVAVLGECLYSYRIHDASLTKGDPMKRAKYIERVLRKACERRGLDFDTRFPDALRWPERNSARENGLATDFMESAVDLRDAGQWWKALRTGFACARLHPIDPIYYKALLCAVLPVSLRRAVRPSERLG